MYGTALRKKTAENALAASLDGIHERGVLGTDWQLRELYVTAVVHAADVQVLIISWMRFSRLSLGSYIVLKASRLAAACTDGGVQRTNLGPWPRTTGIISFPFGYIYTDDAHTTVLRFAFRDQLWV